MNYLRKPNKDEEPKRPTKRLEEDFQGPQEMVGTCPAMYRVFHLIRKMAHTDLPVLVTGASGTGKEMVATAIHQRSPREEGPFVAVNCGAIPRDLLESEFFGHEKGSFTGAYRSVIGKAEQANHGTLFLDEVGELPLDLQVKLLRFLQEYSFERVGGRQKIQVDVRIISATNCDLKELIAAGRFRDDLYYRLNGITIEMPDLKDRGADILIMATFFLKQYSAQLGKDLRGFTPEAVKALQSYPWPGNIRELINHIRRAVVMAEDRWVTPVDLELGDYSVGHDHANLGLKEARERLEAKMITEALARFRGNVQKAAQALKISRSAFYYLAEKYHLKHYFAS